MAPCPEPAARCSHLQWLCCRKIVFPGLQKYATDDPLQSVSLCPARASPSSKKLSVTEGNCGTRSWTLEMKALADMNPTHRPCHPGRLTKLQAMKARMTTLSAFRSLTYTRTVGEVCLTPSRSHNQSGSCATTAAISWLGKWQKYFFLPIFPSIYARLKV